MTIYMSNEHGILSNIFNKLNPFDAPELYSRRFGKNAESTITMVDKTGALTRYELLSTLNLFLREPA